MSHWFFSNKFKILSLCLTCGFDHKVLFWAWLFGVLQASLICMFTYFPIFVPFPAIISVKLCFSSFNLSCLSVVSFIPINLLSVSLVSYRSFWIHFDVFLLFFKYLWAIGLWRQPYPLTLILCPHIGPSFAHLSVKFSILNFALKPFHIL